MTVGTGIGESFTHCEGEQGNVEASHFRPPGVPEECLVFLPHDMSLR